MQRPNAAQLAYGSAVVVLATGALLLLSATTDPLAIALFCGAGLALGLLVAVRMPVRTRPVKTPDAAPPAPSDAEIRVPAPRVGAGAETRIRS